MRKWFWFVLLSACEQPDPSIGTVQNASNGDVSETCVAGSNGWSININQVLDVGIGKEGIPALDEPQFTLASEVDYLVDDELVIAYRNGNSIKVYPHRIMDHHEIVNDNVGGLPVCISLCPLTGTSISWKRNIEGEVRTFGVSGLLYESNLMPYDRKTETTYSQMLRHGVHGENVCDFISTVSSIEVNWKYIKDFFPDALVLNANTGFSRNYNSPPISFQRNELGSPLFTTQSYNPKIPAFRRVLGIISGGTSFVLDLKGDQDQENIFALKLNSKEITAFYIKEYDFISAFSSLDLSGNVLNLQRAESNDGAVLQDQFGNRYDAFGFLLNNNDQTIALQPVTNFAGYWYSFDIIYPNHIFVKDGQI